MSKPATSRENCCPASAARVTGLEPGVALAVALPLEAPAGLGGWQWGLRAATSELPMGPGPLVVLTHEFTQKRMPC